MKRKKTTADKDTDEEIMADIEAMDTQMPIKKKKRRYKKKLKKEESPDPQRRSLILKALKSLDLKDKKCFPTVHELREVDPNGDQLLSLLQKLCQHVHYDENYCEFVAMRLVEFSKSPEAKIPINRQNSDGISLLHNVVISKKLNIVNILVTKLRANLNILDKKSRTPLHYAALKGHVPMVAQLIELGADVTKKDYRKLAIFDYACEREDVELAHLLLSVTQKAILDTKSGSNIVALWFKAVRKASLGIIKLLTPHVDINKRDQEGRTALHIACEGGDHRMIAYLLGQANIEIYKQDRSNYIPLECALLSEECNLEILRLFLKKGIGCNDVYTLTFPVEDEAYDDSEKITFRDATLLHIFSFLGKYQEVKILLKYGSNPNAQDADNMTALHYAVLGDHPEVVSRLLIEPKVRTNIENQDYLTALELSRSEKKEVITQLIRESDSQRKEMRNFFAHPYGKFQVRSLDVTYGAKLDSKKTVHLKNNLRHENMRLRGLLAKNKGKELGNYVTASLTFVVSNVVPNNVGVFGGTSRHRFTVSIDIELPEKLFHMTDLYPKNRSEQFLKNILYRYKSSPKQAKEEVTSSKKDMSKPLDAKMIKTIFKSPQEPDYFYRRFHHSEQVLNEYLEREESVKKIVDQLKKERQVVEDTKIYFIILDVYSTVYLIVNGSLNMKH